MKPQGIIEYYSGAGIDDRGRRLAEIQGWPDESLETVHDFIQWMFPLRERSGVNPSAPILDDNIVTRFRSSPELQANLRLSFIRMLRFYGFECRYSPDTQVIRGPAYKERISEWMSPGNHNYLRITRILKSLSLLGLEEEARKFFACLADIYNSQGKRDRLISPETFRYWKDAILN